MNEPTTSRGVDVCSVWLADFRYRPQLKLCDADGTCKRMTPELRATMQDSDQKRYDDIFAFQFPELEKYHGGPRFCGKQPGICAGNHCRSVHFRLADNKVWRKNEMKTTTVALSNSGGLDSNFTQIRGATGSESKTK